jgi:4-diphosphocytidyl-2-C-methyl-D-erythritol kinase
MAVSAFAPAKINLTLHVTGRRDDGYHLLDSLVVFADVGDELFAEPAAELSLALAGPMAGRVPEGGDNLVLRAARMVCPPGRGAALRLHKALPVSAGLGGGSADAAAAVRAIAALYGLPLPDAAALAPLGADVPACLAARPVRMCGIGERLHPVAIPPLHFVLVNPGVSLSTPEVFTALEKKENAPMPEEFPAWPDAASFCRWLAARRNDLETPACALAPAVGDVLARLDETEGCLLARMSGSGATCFGLFGDAAAARRTAEELARAFPGWWVRAAASLQAGDATEG